MIALGQLDDRQFKRRFRMSRMSFEALLATIRHDLERNEGMATRSSGEPVYPTAAQLQVAAPPVAPASPSIPAAAPALAQAKFFVCAQEVVASGRWRCLGHGAFSLSTKNWREKYKI
jgi:hypothetical protein